MFKSIKCTTSLPGSHVKNHEHDYSLQLFQDATIHFSSIKPWKEGAGHLYEGQPGKWWIGRGLVGEFPDYMDGKEKFPGFMAGSLCSRHHEKVHKEMHDLGAKYAWITIDEVKPQEQNNER